MKRFLLIWIAAFSSLVFPAPSSFAYNPRHVTEDHFFSLDFLAQVQERDVADVGQQLIPCCKFKADAVSTRLLAQPGLRLIQPLELYGLIGGADLNIDDFNVDGFDSRMNLAYGGGLRLVLFESPLPGYLRLFLDAHYLHFKAKDHVLTTVDPDTVPNTGDEFQREEDEKIRWNEYVAKIGVEARHDIFRPYGGLRVSFVRGTDHLSQSGDLDLEEDDNVGVFGGVDIFLDRTQAVALNLEFSLFDVDSISAGLRLAF